MRNNSTQVIVILIESQYQLELINERACPEHEMQEIDQRTSHH